MLCTVHRLERQKTREAGFPFPQVAVGLNPTAQARWTWIPAFAGMTKPL